MHFASAAEVIDRRSDTLENRSYGVRAGEALNEFVADVSSLEIREDEHVCFAGNRAARSFGSSDGFDECSVGLQFTIQSQLRRHLFGELGSLGYFVHEFVLSATFGREGEHSYAGLDASDSTCGLCGRDSDLSELFGIRIRVHCTIGEEQETVLSQVLSRREHQERTADDRATGFGLEDLEGRTNRVCRRAACASQLTVGVAGFDHQAAEVQRILRFLSRLFLGHTFGFTELEEQVSILRHLRIMDRIYDLSLLDILIPFLSSHSLDFLGIAN